MLPVAENVIRMNQIRPEKLENWPVTGFESVISVPLVGILTCIVVVAADQDSS